MPHKAVADGFQNREATVFIKNDELANKLGTRFLEECDATQRSGSSHVEVTCWGSFSVAVCDLTLFVGFLPNHPNPCTLAV